MNSTLHVHLLNLISIKKHKVKIYLLTDIGILLMIEKGIRNDITYVTLVY